MRGTVIVAVSAPRTSIQPCTSAPEHVAAIPVKTPELKLPTEETPPNFIKPEAAIDAKGTIH